MTLGLTGRVAHAFTNPATTVRIPGLFLTFRFAVRFARRLRVAVEGAFDEVETLDTELACCVGIYGELLDVTLRRRIALEGAGIYVEREVVRVALSCSIMC